MVSPAMQLASKIPDKKLQTWSASLLAGESREYTSGPLFYTACPLITVTRVLSYSGTSIMRSPSGQHFWAVIRVEGPLYIVNMYVGTH